MARADRDEPVRHLVLVVASVELLPKGFSDVTLSVRAQTEVLLLELQPERTYVWWLPGGSYSLLTAKGATGCEERSRFDVVCPYSGPTAITIKNGATVRFELTTAEGAAMPRFLLALTPRAAPRTRKATTRSVVRGAERRRRAARRDARARDVRVAAGSALAHPADRAASADRRVVVG